MVHNLEEPFRDIPAIAIDSFTAVDTDEAQRAAAAVPWGPLALLPRTDPGLGSHMLKMKHRSSRDLDGSASEFCQRRGPWKIWVDSTFSLACPRCS